MDRYLAGVASALALTVTVSTASAADQIRILAPTWLGFAPVHVALERGCFAENGLDVSIRFEDDLANVMAAMQRGDIEIQMRSVGEYQGRPRDRDTPGIIIGTIDESVGGDGVITDEAIQSVADLQGKVIASEPNIPSRLLLQMELKEAGLTLEDLNIRDIATADTAAVFADESIAAIATYEPFMSQAIATSSRPGARILVSSKDHPGLIIDAIIARNDDLQANPDKYARFLDCIYKAVDFIKAEPDSFAEIAAGEFGLTPEEVTEIVQTTLTYNTLDEALDYMGAPGERGKLHDIFDTVMELNLENGAAENKLVAEEQIDNSVINRLR
ncbi:ABC transporter substrate-binding protein [Chelativorans sp. AA-79]|uniref:ABC transporter substrate-binding protein n=1 Tax=Chelativorans sp. AA-79 TaxID=3028735 RepID=UPI0023F844CA|nr:ABC transporter substrate-binding protein [Chelativorans sp. AA-79]WEX08679.1 ABC transporter substrate-binding protein [Chelativorans sp. AA-79]